MRRGKSDSFVWKDSPNTDIIFLWNQLHGHFVFITQRSLDNPTGSQCVLQVFVGGGQMDLVLL